MTICYDGEAFRRVLALKAAPEQRARAALALTRAECVDPNPLPLARAQVNQWRADVLERVDAGALPAYLRNRVQMRRTVVYSTVAYERTRQGHPADSAAQRALVEFTGIARSELTDGDQSAYNDAAMRVDASRWAAQPVALAVMTNFSKAQPLSRGPASRAKPACCWWTRSTTRRARWRAAAPTPSSGAILRRREARGEGRYKKSFEVLKLASVTGERQAAEASMLRAFRTWQDAGWKSRSVSLR